MNLIDMSLFRSHPLAAIAVTKMAKQHQKDNPGTSEAPDATHILEDAFEQMSAYSTLIREGNLDPEEQQRVFIEMNALHKATTEDYLTNLNVYSLKDPERTLEVLNRFTMIYFEGIHGAIMSPFEESQKPKVEPKDFLDEASQYIQRIAPKLSGSDYVKGIKRFGSRDVAAVLYDTQNGVSYGFNTVYIVWKDDEGILHHKELTDSRDTKDYIHLEDILERNGKFTIKISTGGTYGGEAWEKNLLVDGREMGIVSNNIDKDPLRAQIEKMFPDKNAQALESIVKSLDEGISSVTKTTDLTHTGFVTDFMVDGKRIYAKGSNDTTQLEKEASYHKDAWTHSLMRPITPKLIGTAVEDGLCVLLTYGTQNTGIIPDEDLQAYLQLRERIMDDFASRQRLNPDSMKQDPFAIDAFNRAVAHTCMKEHMGKEIYSEDKSSIIIPFPTLVERAGRTDDKGLFELLRAQAEQYHTAVVEYLETDSGESSLLYFDSRPENVFPDNSNTLVRPVGDFGFSRPGPVAVDLSRLESGKDSIYVPLYAHTCNVLEQEAGNDFELSSQDIASLQTKVHHLSFINLARALSSKLSRNCNDEARRYLTLAYNHLEAA